MKYIDLHCDTLMHAFLRNKMDIYDMPETMLDLKRMKLGGVLAQFFAVFLPPEGAEKMVGRPLPADDDYIDLLIGILRNSIETHPDCIAWAYGADDLEENRKQGKMSAFLTIEDGRSVDGNMEKLKAYHQKGIRLISLTWNAPNCFGYPNSRDGDIMGKGLTSFGKEAVEYMDELGIVTDVSHLSDGGFYDVAQVCRGPFVASHSNCRALTNHPRNLTDDMIKVLADKGGVAGVNFGAEFLSGSCDGKISRIGDITAHILHFVRYGGEECVSIGTDFDGISGEFEIGSPDKMELLFEALKKGGMSERQIELLAYKNAMRVMREVLAG